MHNEYQISSFDDYVKVMEKYKGNYLFRGQANIEWKITPSIFRDENSLKDEANSILTNEFFDANNIATSIFKMQHFGQKTRMIDLTNSIYTSLFIACDGEMDTNGSVYIFDKQTLKFSEKEEVEGFCKILIEKTMNDMTFPDETLQKYTKDMFLNYSYDFSYSNDRAILQGGTAILVGLGLIGNKLNRKKNLNIENYVCEKIIVPNKIKTKILGDLSEMGYTSAFLYGNFDYSSDNNDIELEEINKNICKLANKTDSAYKIVSAYKINNLTYNLDKLYETIKKQYQRDFLTYGSTAKIFMNVYCDEKDFQEKNCVCSATWSKKSPCNIVWNKNHMQTRLRAINEQINSEEVLEKGVSVFIRACEIESKFREYYKKLPFKEFISKIKSLRIEIGRLFVESGDVKHCEGEIDSYFNSVHNYVDYVNQLIGDLIIYQESGERLVVLKDFITTQLEQCRLQNEKVILP